MSILVITLSAIRVEAQLRGAALAPKPIVPCLRRELNRAHRHSVRRLTISDLRVRENSFLFDRRVALVPGISSSGNLITPQYHSPLRQSRVECSYAQHGQEGVGQLPLDEACQFQKQLIADARCCAFAAHAGCMQCLAAHLLSC